MTLADPAHLRALAEALRRDYLLQHFDYDRTDVDNLAAFLDASDAIARRRAIEEAISVAGRWLAGDGPAGASGVVKALRALLRAPTSEQPSQTESSGAALSRKGRKSEGAGTTAEGCTPSRGDDKPEPQAAMPRRGDKPGETGTISQAPTSEKAEET